MGRQFKSLTELAAFKASLEDKKRQAALKAQQEAERLAALEREKNLFKLAVGEVAPIDNNDRVVIEPPKPKPLPIKRWEDDADVLVASMSDHMDIERLLDTDEQLSFRREGIGPETIKKLRKGRWVIQRQLDLHGYRTDEAREAVAEFIRDCMRTDMRCVRIVHGKGLGSAGKEPVLKDKVRRWLVQKDEVLAFCQATPKEGGAGALLVLLKSQ